MDFAPIVQRAAEPPQVSIRLGVRGLEFWRSRRLYPASGNDLMVVPAAACQDELPDFCHVARSQAQPPSRIRIALDPNPIDVGNSQRIEQGLARKFVEGAP